MFELNLCWSAEFEMHNKPSNLTAIIHCGIFKWVFQAGPQGVRDKGAKGGGNAAILLIDMQIQVYILESVAEFMPTAEQR